LDTSAPPKVALDEKFDLKYMNLNAIYVMYDNFVALGYYVWMD
jgi:hypothetical protein